MYWYILNWIKYRYVVSSEKWYICNIASRYYFTKTVSKKLKKKLKQGKALHKHCTSIIFEFFFCKFHKQIRDAVEWHCKSVLGWQKTDMHGQMLQSNLWTGPQGEDALKPWKDYCLQLNNQRCTWFNLLKHIYCIDIYFHIAGCMYM